MSWAKLDDQFFAHVKVIDLSKDAKLLYLAALTYCASQLSDGMLTPGAVRMAAAMVDVDRACADELVAADLWAVTNTGYYIHDYLDYNPSAEEVKAEREAARDRMRKVRSREVLPNIPHTFTGSSASPSPSPSPSPSVVTTPTVVVNSEGDSHPEEEGAAAPAVVASKNAAAHLSLCSEVAKAAKIGISADELRNLLEQHKDLGRQRLIFEAELAAEWIADPQRNKPDKQGKPKRTMSRAFLNNWYLKAGQSPGQTSPQPSSSSSPQEATRGRSATTYAATPAATRSGREVITDPAFWEEKAALLAERRRLGGHTVGVVGVVGAG